MTKTHAIDDSLAGSLWKAKGNLISFKNIPISILSMDSEIIRKNDTFMFLNVGSMGEKNLNGDVYGTYVKILFDGKIQYLYLPIFMRNVERID